MQKLNENTARFRDVTEMEGQLVSKEQLERTCHRYHWSISYIKGKKVLEVACGSGPGIGLLSDYSSALIAGDYSPEVLSVARSTYGEKFDIEEFSAESLPFDSKSIDVVVFFEALYYVDSDKFFRECYRVLTKNGTLLIVTANKDLFDFNRSPYSTKYLGTVELGQALTAMGFSVRCFGAWSTAESGPRQRLLRPVKFVAARLGLIPKTMFGKEFLKRMFFGKLVPMPRDIRTVEFDYRPPTPIPTDVADRTHKVIYCAATIDEER